MVAYATRDDVYRVGVPRGSLVNPARSIASVNTTANSLELDDHGFALDREVQFVVDEGGALPSPLVAGTVYFAIPVSGSESTFKVAATAGGAAIDLTTAGTDSFGVLASLGPEIDREIAQHSEWFSEVVIGTAQPLESPYPEWVVAVVAKLTAASLVRRLGLSKYQGIVDEATEARNDAIRMGGSGKPLRTVNRPTNLAVAASAADPDRGTIS